MSVEEEPSGSGGEGGHGSAQPQSERERDGVLSGIRVDIRRLHAAWLGVLFPRQLEAEHSVLGKWRPETTGGKVKYWSWAALGALLLAVLYPLALFGFGLRFYARRADSTATRLGLLGVVLLSVLVWGALTAAVYLRLSLTAVAAVGSASVVATLAAMLAYLSARRGRRLSTVLLAYPFAVTAIFLPPVVAALYSPAVAAAVFPRSENLAVVILDDLLPMVPVIGERTSALLRANFELQGVAYALMWFGIAVPVGWTLGTVVTLADIVRPKED